MNDRDVRFGRAEAASDEVLNLIDSSRPEVVEQIMLPDADRASRKPEWE